MNIIRLKNMEYISQKLTHDLAESLAEAAAKKDKFNMALSGGSTPLRFYDFLAQTKLSISWKDIHFFWGDERCVPPDDVQSNFGQASKSFLSKINIPPPNIHRIRGRPIPIWKRRVIKRNCRIIYNLLDIPYHSC